MEHGVDSLVAIGGDGTFHGALALEKETGIPVMGVPGTIDNDIYGTEDTIGFDTAINTALESIDRIRDTADSHERLFLIEVMGRHCGMIAAYAGIAGGAETIIVPEEHQGETAILKQIENRVRRGMKRGKRGSIVVVAEGHSGGGIAERLAQRLKPRGFNPRVAVLGHIQRGGTPTAKDRTLASAMGAFAVDCLLKGKSCGMTALQAKGMTYVSFQKVLSKKKQLPTGILTLADTLAT